MNLIEFIYASNKAQSVEELLSSFIEFITEYNFDKYIISEISTDHNYRDGRKFGLITNYPDALMNEYIEKNLVENDPIYKRALTSRRPFPWSDMRKENLTDKEKSAMADVEKYGFYQGITVTIYQPLGRIIGISLATPDRNRVFDDNTLMIMNLLCNQFYARFSCLLDQNKLIDEPANITDREREVLLWIAKGKTKKDIACILDISESCVKRHCENIFKKLEVNNLPYAVVKALRMGLINPF